MEIWKEWKPGIMVSSMGNITGISKFNRGQGYYAITYKKKTYNLHRIIAELFIPNPSQKPVVDHINRDRKDNRIENLRWTTHQENVLNKERFDLKSKTIQCIETGKVYFGAYSIRHNYNDQKNISRAIKNNIRLAGYHWKYISRTGNLQYKEEMPS